MRINSSRGTWAQLCRTANMWRTRAAHVQANMYGQQTDTTVPERGSETKLDLRRIASRVQTSTCLV
jgi:hypothetical protein